MDEKMDTTLMSGWRKPAKETPTEHTINVVFSLAFFATVVGLGIYFR